MSKSIGSREKIAYFSAGGLILLGGFLLLIFRLNQESVWYDEAFSWAITNHSLPEMLKLAVSVDFHPPLYILMIKAFSLLFGNSIEAIRLFSVFGAVALAALGLGPIRRACGAKTGLLFCGLVFLLPIIQGMAREARMYTWAPFFVTGTIIYADLAATSGKRGDWVKLGVFTLGAAYIHYYALIAAAIVNCFLLAWLTRNERRGLRPYLIAMGAVFICYLPWIAMLFAQTMRAKQSFWIPPVSFQLIQRTVTYPFGGKPPSDSPGMFVFRPYAFWFTWGLLGWGIWKTMISKKHPEGHGEKWRTCVRQGACARQGAFRSKIFKRPANITPTPAAPALNLWAIGTYLLTILAAIILSYLIRPILVDRYTMAVIGLLILSIAITLSRIPQKTVFWGALLLFFALCLPSVFQNYQQRFNGPMDEVAAFLKPELTPDAVLIHNDWLTMGAVSYYFPGHEHFIFLPKAGGNYPEPNFPKTSCGSGLDSILNTHKNIWMVYGFVVSETDPSGEVIAGEKLTVISGPKVFKLPHSWYAVSVTQVAW